MQQHSRVSSRGSAQSTASSSNTALVASRQACKRLVLTVDGQKPETSGTPQKVRTTRLLWTHGIPQQISHVAVEHRGPPPCCCIKTRSGQGDARLGPPTFKIPAGNPCSKRRRRTHHSVGTPSIYPPFTQRAQHNGTTSRLHAHLLGEKNLPTGRFLSGPSPSIHPCDSLP